MPLLLQIFSDSQEHTQRIAAALAPRLRSGDVVAIEGELGAGKTIFVSGLVQGLGIHPGRVSSPTFVIRHEYSSDMSSLNLIHIDAYRLGGQDDLETIGWAELLHEPDVIVAIEWPSRIETALPANRINVTIEHTGLHSRAISISAPVELEDRLQDVASIAKRFQRAGQSECRKCGAPVDQESPTFPFCSERCRLADLGRWFNEGYRVSREMKADEDLLE